MRNALGILVAAALLGSLPASGQMRPAPILRARVQPLRLPYRAAYAPIRQAPPAVRVEYVRPVTSAPRTGQLVTNTIPASSTVTSGATRSSFSPTGFGGTPIPLDQLLNQVPGLGFDYNHLAAINSGLAVRAFIDPITEHESAIAEQLPQEQPVGLGFFPAYAAGVPAEYPAQQPEVIVVQQPAAQPPEETAPAGSTAKATAAPATPAPPLPNVGTFLLVRRDGRVVHAIAFSQQGSQVVYITAAGMRRSLPLDELNIAATEQRNAERGTILHLTE